MIDCPCLRCSEEEFLEEIDRYFCKHINSVCDHECNDDCKGTYKNCEDYIPKNKEG